MSVKFNRRHFIAAGTAAAAMPCLARGASAQGTWPSRNIRMVCSYPAGGQTDLLARAFGDYIAQAGGADGRRREQGGRLRFDRRGGSRACGARWSHHPVLDLDDLCDEPGHVEEPRLRHGQGSDARQHHSGPGAVVDCEQAVRRQDAGRLRRVRAQKGPGELRHLQRRLVAAHDHHCAQQAVSVSRSSRSTTAAKRRCGRG